MDVFVDGSSTQSLLGLGYRSRRQLDRTHESGDFCWAGAEELSEWDHHSEEPKGEKSEATELER